MRGPWLAVWIALGGCAGILQAHPVPRDNHDRTIVVHLGADALIIDFRVELDDFRLYRDLDGVDLQRRPGEEVHQAYLRHFGPLWMSNLVATLDGKEVELECLEQGFRVLDHIRCDFRFRARWKIEPGQSAIFTFRDDNYPQDITSAVRLTYAVSPDLTARQVEAPPEAWFSRPTDSLDPRQRDLRRRLKMQLLATPSFPAGVSRPTLPPDPEPARLPPMGRFIPGRAKPASPEAVGVVRTTGPETVAPPGKGRMLDLLFDSRMGVGLLLLLFAGFGAGHALTPGHGKTLVAAYLVGERGTYGHAFLLGLVTTLTHTGVVMVIALALPLIFPDAPPAAVQAILGLVGGLLIAGLGAWLLLKRIAGQSDHLHVPGLSHSHSHGSEANQPLPPGWWGVVLLGISGGLVPCWDALLIPAVCLAAQRPGLAWPLVVAFSAGLAGVLVLLGLIVVRARNLARPWMESDGGRRVTRALPIVSAFIILGLGLWLCYESARGFGS